MTRVAITPIRSMFHYNQMFTNARCHGTDPRTWGGYDQDLDTGSDVNGGMDVPVEGLWSG